MSRIIGLFGDSFGYQKKDEPYPSWVDLLSQQHAVDNHCECGVSEYKILKQLETANLDKYNVIIVTHTSYSRVFVEHNPLHADSKYHKNCDILAADVESRNDEFSRACQLYYKYIFNDDHARDMYNLILKEIDRMLNGKTAIHMTHFDHAGLHKFNRLLEFNNLFLANRGPVNHYTEFANKLVADRVLLEI